MKILCCYAELDPETERRVKAYAPGTVFVDTSLDHYAYWRAIRDAWDGKQDLVIIEQDIGITPEVIPSFEKCGQLRCAFSYNGYGRTYTKALGCAKFSARLQSMYPPAPANLIPPGSGIEISWQYIDGIINVALDEMEPHVHGSVEHFRDYRDYSLDNIVAPAFSGVTIVHNPVFKYNCNLDTNGNYQIKEN